MFDDMPFIIKDQNEVNGSDEKAVVKALWERYQSQRLSFQEQKAVFEQAGIMAGPTDPVYGQEKLSWIQKFKDALYVRNRVLVGIDALGENDIVRIASVGDLRWVGIYSVGEKLWFELIVNRDQTPVAYGASQVLRKNSGEKIFIFSFNVFEDIQKQLLGDGKSTIDAKRLLSERISVLNSMTGVSEFFITPSQIDRDEAIRRKAVVFYLKFGFRFAHSNDPQVAELVARVLDNEILNDEEIMILAKAGAMAYTLPPASLASSHIFLQSPGRRALLKAIGGLAILGVAAKTGVDLLTDDISKKFPNQALKGSFKWQQIQSLISDALSDPIIENNPDFVEALQGFREFSQEVIYLTSDQLFGVSYFTIDKKTGELTFGVGINYERIEQLLTKYRQTQNRHYLTAAYGILIKEGAIIPAARKNPEYFKNFVKNWNNKKVSTGENAKALIAKLVYGESIGYKVLVEYLLATNPNLDELVSELLKLAEGTDNRFIRDIFVAQSDYLLSQYFPQQYRDLTLRAVVFVMTVDGGLSAQTRDLLIKTVASDGYPNAMQDIQNLQFLTNPKLLNPFVFLTDSAYIEKSRNDRFGAFLSSSSAVGGINFDPANMDLQIKRNGKGVPLPLPQQNLEQINIQGLFPVIINIIPMNAQTLPIFLGFNRLNSGDGQPVGTFGGQLPKQPAPELELADTTSG